MMTAFWLLNTKAQIYLSKKRRSANLEMYGPKPTMGSAYSVCQQLEIFLFLMAYVSQGNWTRLYGFTASLPV